MSGACRFGGDLEAYVFGELTDARATEVLVHLAACDACSAEVLLLRDERRIFRERAASDALPAPSFADVMVRLANEPAPVARLVTRERMMIAGALAAAAGFAFFFASTPRTPAAAGSAPIVEVSNEMCWDGDPDPSEACSVAPNRSIASNAATSEDDCVNASFRQTCSTDARDVFASHEQACCEEASSCNGR